MTSIAKMTDPIMKMDWLSRDRSADSMRGRIEWLDGLRGLAAVGVVLFHFYIGTKTLTQEAPSWVNHLAASGRFGVWLFFVISGFILTHTLLPRTGLRTAKGVGLYMLRRSVRLDPVYWVILTLFIAASFWISNPDWITPEGRWPHRLFYNYFYFVPQPFSISRPCGP
jgi:peptidoglycan/LPS O-acetylase OafA/YrhL